MKLDRVVPLILLVAVSVVFARPGMSGERPTLIQAQAPAVSAYVKPKITHEPYGQVKIVVPLTSDDKGLQRLKLANISNSLKAADAWKGTFTIRMVLYGKGVVLLRNPDEETRKVVDVLRSQGVRFDVCDNSLAAMGIDFHTLYGVTEADIVPSGFAEVAYLQARQGYVVNPAN